MSTPEPDTGPEARAGSGPVPSGGRTTRSHQPWRAMLAVAELVVAAVLVAGAFWMWGRAVVPIELSQLGGRAVTRMAGDRVALSFALATVAGLLLLDAVRQLPLSSRVRPGRYGEV